METTHNILVIDDSKIFRETIAQTLREEGYCVHCGCNVFESMALITEYPIDLILLDILMPDVNGFVLLKELKVFENNYEVIIVSGQESFDDAATAMQHGAYSFLKKPVQRKDLLAHVYKALEMVKVKKKRFDYLQMLENQVRSRTKELEDSVTMLENQSARLDTIINSMGEGLVALDNTYSIVLINDCAQKILGLHFADCAGQNIALAIKDKKKADVILSVLREDVSNNSHKAMAQFRTDDCMVRYYNINAQKIQDSLGASTGYVVTFLDQTEKIRADVFRTSFLSIVAHELRTPINIIMNYLSILGNQGDNVTMIKTAVKDIKKSNNRMKYLVDNIMSFVNLSNTTISMYKVQLDVESFVRGEILKCKSFALERKVTFVFKSSVGSMSIYSDVKLLQSAIGNVLHNAVKFNKTHGAAYVELSKMVGKDKSESLVIEITDEGEGISEKAKVSLFESFVQGEDHLTRQHEGLGAGMFLAKRALGFLGGSISVTSELTKGSMFRIVLPTAREGAVI